MLVNLKEILEVAKKGGYAVGYFNAMDTDMIQSVIYSAEEVGAPVVLGTAEDLLPFADFDVIAPSLINMAKKAKVPVCIHFDHGFTYEKCALALKHGFTSIMFDGSSKSESENIAQTAELAKLAHAFGASIEGEIGHVGNAEDEENEVYTTVEEAVNFVNKTGVDALAIAIGTAHGAYRRKPELNIDRLKEIRKAIDTPLVLHGGSGLTEEDFRTAINNGILKVNIFTDICIAGKQAFEVGVEKDLHYLQTQQVKLSMMKEQTKKKLLLFKNGKETGF